MEFQAFFKKYIEQKAIIHDYLLDFFENKKVDDIEEIIHKSDDQKIREDKHELRNFLHLISKISKNRYQTTDFINKIERILKTFSEDIKNNLTNHEIFNIFKGNKRILLLLLDEKLVIPTESIACIITSVKYRKKNYDYYFYPEFESFYSPDFVKRIKEIDKNVTKNSIELFEQLRRKGENEKDICEIIRNDSIDEFISYCNEEQNTYHEFASSCFETNSFLLKKLETSFIEYAAFYGSIKIFQYLLGTEVNPKSTLWYYAVHSNKIEIIQLLENYHVRKEDNCFKKMLLESIKCHHFKITEYLNNLNRISLHDSKIFGSYNYHFININEYIIDSNCLFDMFFTFCKYDYFAFVNFILNQPVVPINVNTKIIFNKIILNEICKRLFMKFLLFIVIKLLCM